MITQKKLSDPIRDLKLSKNKAELFSSRLQQWNLLDDSLKLTEFWFHPKDLSRLHNTRWTQCFRECQGFDSSTEHQVQFGWM